MPGNPKQDQFQVKGAPKSTEHDQNLISSEGGRDTSEYQNSGHSSHFSQGKIWKPQIRLVSLSQSGTKKEENQQTVTKI